MKTVIQRVSRASLEIGGAVHARIDRGLVALVGIETSDTPDDREWTAEKIAGLRIFPDAAGKMNLSVQDAPGAVLIVPNFTVAGDASRGRRPSFDGAMRPPEAQTEFESLCAAVRARGVPVETGVFGADMQVALVNDGPVTIVLDSKRRS
jgi:D-tyrosyl-tRNA(Tyr) deacylase